MSIKSLRFVIQTHFLCFLFLRACHCRYLGYIADVSELLLSQTSNRRGRPLGIIDFRTTCIYVYTPPLAGTRIYTGISPPLQRYTFRNLHTHTHTYIYRVSQEERTKLREDVPYVKLYRYNPKHLYPKLNSYGDNGKRSLKF